MAFPWLSHGFPIWLFHGFSMGFPAALEVPKRHIRRVGAHEAHSAVRAQELGDGSVECREAVTERLGDGDVGFFLGNLHGKNPWEKMWDI